MDAPNPATAASLLSQGFALAGSAYRRTGWALDDAFTDQPALLDFFTTQYGAPKRTIAWGTSLGGMITAGLLQKFPTRFDAGLSMCGVLGGGVAQWNLRLDSMFVIKTLIAPDADLPLVHITDPAGTAKQFETLLNQAQTTPAGRARIALAAAVWNTPGWFDRLAPEPAPTDYAAREQTQLQWTLTSMLPYAFVRHAELESRTGGNPAWNTGVDYRQLLAGSVDTAEVAALYEAAGLSLDDDLATLDQAPRIANDPQATTYLTQNIIFDGKLAVPMLTLHTTGDGQQPVQQEEIYADVVQAAGRSNLLRQVFVQRAGHCTFTSGEMIAALQYLVNRLDTGTWNTSNSPAQVLNAAGNALDPTLNTLSGAENKPVAVPPAFVAYQPTAFLRPFDVRS
jgi:pimeloyl-ACP methyl ester carboxylesterase